MILTREPIGKTLGSAAMVVPAIGFLPSEVRPPPVYAYARNLRPFPRIEVEECLCLSSDEVAIGDNTRLSATSSLNRLTPLF